MFRYSHGQVIVHIRKRPYVRLERYVTLYLPFPAHFFFQRARGFSIPPCVRRVMIAEPQLSSRSGVTTSFPPSSARSTYSAPRAKSCDRSNPARTAGVTAAILAHHSVHVLRDTWRPWLRYVTIQAWQAKSTSRARLWSTLGPKCWKPCSRERSEELYRKEHWWCIVVQANFRTDLFFVFFLRFDSTYIRIVQHNVFTYSSNISNDIFLIYINNVPSIFVKTNYPLGIWCIQLFTCIFSYSLLLQENI